MMNAAGRSILSTIMRTRLVLEKCSYVLREYLKSMAFQQAHKTESSTENNGTHSLP